MLTRIDVTTTLHSNVVPQRVILVPTKLAVTIYEKIHASGMFYLLSSVLGIFLFQKIGYLLEHIWYIFRENIFS
eukprot:UN25168